MNLEEIIINLTDSELDLLIYAIDQRRQAMIDEEKQNEIETEERIKAEKSCDNCGKYMTCRERRTKCDGCGSKKYD